MKPLSAEAFLKKYPPSQGPQPEAPLRPFPCPGWKSYQVQGDKPACDLQQPLTCTCNHQAPF